MKRVGSVQAFGQCWRWSVVAALGLALVAGPAPAIRADTPTTERVSLTQGGAQANNISFNPAISADGRYVAFESAASNLVPGGAAGHRNIFIRDRATGTTELVSVAAGGTGAD